MNKHTKIFIALVLIECVLMITTCILCLNIKQSPKEVEIVPVIKIVNTDTIPTFLNKTPKEGLKEALIYYDIKHKDIVYAQAILESNLGNSNLYRRTNNLFCLYNGKEFYSYNHWVDNVLHYKNCIQNRLKPNEDYYEFLERIHYAEDPEYINKLKRIVKLNKQD